MINFKYEKQFKSPIVGIDEAGRGPLAGPVVTCALFFKEFQAKDFYHKINDSKKITAPKREILYNEITTDPNIIYAINVCDSETIDKLNILEATKQSMTNAYKSLNITANQIFIDGNHKMSDFHEITTNIIKGDSLVLSIAAASIIAKVARDKLMIEYNSLYPEYNFAKHKGYGTKLHIEKLRQYGPSPIHRKSFAPVKNIKYL